MTNNYLFVIGINKYRSPQISDLNNAVNDAKDVIKILVERYGFELLPEPLFDEQATKENIYTGFTRLVSELLPEDNLIIYFSGHGRMHPLTGKGYWVPYDASDTPVDFVENSVVKDFIGAMKSSHVFLIADSCFSGTFLSTTRGGIKEIKYEDLLKKTSRWMLASGGEETVGDGAKGKNSPFARNLLEFLTINANKHISVEEIIRYVSVVTAAEVKQKPVGASIENIGHEGGQMILTLKPEFISTTYETTKAIPHTEALLKKFRAVYKVKSSFAAGKDVIAIESFVEDADILIIELFRFDDSGVKKITFRDDFAIFNDKDGDEIKWKVIQRFATMDGLGKFVEENEQLFDEKKVVVMGASSEIETVEENERVIQHKEALQDLYDMNTSPMRCLHCSNMITTNDSYLVEIDEDGLRPSVGNVHNKCLRPLDRIMGRTFFEGLKETHLINFDYQKWLSLAKSGQGFLRSAKYSSKEYATPIISWNRKHNFNTGDFCIKMFLEDGSYTYVLLGKEVHRFQTNEIDNEVKWFNDRISENAKEDSYAYTSKGRVFGTISQLEKIKSPDESILRATHCEKAKYSNQLEVIKSIQNDYTPLGIVINAEGQEIVNFGNCIPLLSDPTKFDELHKNWNDAGYTIGKCNLRIIETDKDFDLYLIAFLKDGMQPIIDPLFNTDKDLISGIYISDIEELTDQNNHKSGTLLKDPKWKAGDKVKVVFPEARKDKFPEGTIMTDEFEDETGEKRVIFCPIVDGVQRQDLTVTIPSKFIQEL